MAGPLLKGFRSSGKLVAASETEGAPGGESYHPPYAKPVRSTALRPLGPAPSRTIARDRSAGGILNHWSAIKGGNR